MSTGSTPKATRRGRSGGGRTVRLFISYAHLDKDWLDSMLPLLQGFPYDHRMISLKARLNVVDAWTDLELTRGEEWSQEIPDKLAEMNIFVPLLSANFFGSEYIQKVELPTAQKRHEAGEIKVLPIVLHEVNLRAKCPFLHGFTSVPPGKPWSDYRDRRDAQRIVDDALWGAIEAVLKS